jgi:enamine deaminase RidA (YjgF/YER057c/UK114 family)
MIERKPGIYDGRNKSTAYKYLVWAVATSTDTSVSIEQQTLFTLAAIEASLAELGSDKSRIVSAQVYIANMTEKPLMDAVWKKWLGDNPQHWPQRACLGVNLEGDVLIEVTVTAVRGT